MTNQNLWQEGNERYLSAALTWLRLRLERLCSLAVTPIVTDDQIGQAAQAMVEAEALEPPPALLILSQCLGLSRFEQQVLLLCAAMELDTRIASLCASAQDQPTRPYPTFALALTLFDKPAWDILSPERPLRYWRLPLPPSSRTATYPIFRFGNLRPPLAKGKHTIADRPLPGRPRG